MSDTSEWIKFEDAMPKLNQQVEIKFKNNTILRTNILEYLNIENIVEWRPLKSENDKADDWTLFEDKLPKLGKLIEICADDSLPEESKLVLINNDSFRLLDKRYNMFYKPNSYKKWRYKKEGRPDFSKLKKGDIIVGNLVFPDGERNFFAGCFREITEEGWLRMTFRNYPDSVWDGFKIINVQRILKMNPENQTFEEI